MSPNATAYLLALAAGGVYALGAILGKRALASGAGQVRLVILSNLILSLLFIPHFFLAEGLPSPGELFTGVCLAAIFLLGQVLFFRALRSGDASLVSPLMGIKPVLVAFFLVAFGLSPHPLEPKTWIAAVAATVAVALIGWPATTKGANWHGMALALASAATFSLLDAIFPHFSHRGDPTRLLFCVFGSLGLLTLVLLPWAEEPLLRRTTPSDRFTWASALFIALQAVLMSSAIAFYRVPTEVNVVYSCRGLWTVLLVMWIGNRLQLDEGSHPVRVKLRRVAGSILLAIGVVLIA